MNSVELLSKLFADTYEGDAWHGPSLTAVIEGVSAEEASMQPGNKVHSIAEFVSHTAYWMSVVRHWLAGSDITPDQEFSWGPAADNKQIKWDLAKESLAAEYISLKQAIDKFPEEKLAQAAHESGLTYYALIHGIIHHNLYHAGQIALLKKLHGNAV